MTTPPRSTFVSVVAWIFIVLSGFGSAIGVLQNIMFHTVMKPMGFEQTMAQAPPGMPEGMAGLFQHFDLLLVATTSLSVLVLVASIALLQRREWGRKLFIAAMVAGILWQLAGVAFQVYMQSQMQQMMAQQAGAPDFQPFFIGIVVFAALIALTLSGLFGWIAMRLMSPQIVAEFRR